MSLRQRQFIKFLPECNNNIAQAGIKAGYSESYAKSKLYQKVNQGKFKIETEEDIKKQYLKEVKKAKKLMLKNKDNTNYLRAMEIDGKVKGLFKETVVNEGNQKEITVIYGNNTPQPIDIPKDTAISPS